MRLSITHTTNNTYFYMIKSYRDHGKNKTIIVEKLGTLEEVKLKANGKDPVVWAKEYIAQKTAEEKEGKAIYYQKLVEGIPLSKKQKLFNVGYIFLEKLYYDLKLNETCKKSLKNIGIKYDLNKILQDLVYTRIIEPCSKLSSFEVAKKFIEQPDYELHDIYRALEVIAKGTDFIESKVYKNSLNVINRNSKNFIL